MSNKKNEDLTKNKNIDKKEKTFCQVNENVRSWVRFSTMILNKITYFKRRKNDKQFKRLLEESKPLVDLYRTAAYLQKTNGKLPTTLEEYEKNQKGHFPYEIFFSTEIYPNQIKYKLNRMEFKPYFCETLYEFIYDSNTKSLIIENKS